MFALCLLPFITAWAQNGAADSAAAPMTFGYKFENTRFYIPLIEIDLAADGTGELRFKRGESDEVLDRKLKLLPTTAARIRALYASLNFLATDQEYQGNKDFSHLGWMSISAGQGARQRKTRFNFTTNAQMKELADIFRAVATQEIHLFDIEISRQYQQLALPQELEILQRDLELERIAEPTQMIGVLREIHGDNTMPLIARNLAERIIEKIEKGKYKSPVVR